MLSINYELGVIRIVNTKEYCVCCLAATSHIHSGPCLLHVLHNLCHLAATCSLLTAPDNGSINCNLGGDGVANLGDICSFTCNTGFRLNGDQSRTCAMRRNSGRWSGRPVECRACKFFYKIIWDIKISNIQTRTQWIYALSHCACYYA